MKTIPLNPSSPSDISAEAGTKGARRATGVPASAGPFVPVDLQSSQIVKLLKEFKIVDGNYLGKKSRPMQLMILYGSSKRVVKNPR